MINLAQQLSELLTRAGLSMQSAENLTGAIFLVILMLLAYGLDKLLILFGRKLIYKSIKKTKINWDDILMKYKFFDRIIHLIPAFFTLTLADKIFEISPAFSGFFIKAVDIYISLMAILILNAFLKAVNEIYLGFPGAKNRPIKGYIQVVQLVSISLGLIVIISIIIGKSPLIIVGGLGAFAAVLMLIFKDSILGFVAGLQISFNDMVRLGDWVSIPKFGADGTVIDIALTTIKIQNWDKTISTVPSYSVITDSFINWRGMEESGGRRIKRSIRINANSVKFCDNAMLQKFGKIQLISDYIDRKEAELKKYNEENGIDNSVVVNGRRQTNLGVFRAYLEAYLHQRQDIHQGMTFLVRQLQPDEKGIPIEIYVFSKIQAWAEYEGIQADIFDHILAIIPEFYLETFQAPSGKDVREIQIEAKK